MSRRLSRFSKKSEEESYINFYTAASDSDNDTASIHSKSRKSGKSKKDRKRVRDHLSKINESRTNCNFF